MLTGGGCTVSVRLFVAVEAGDAVSVTRTVKFEVPAVVGVPVILPVEAFRAKPPGSVPVEMDQVYGVIPPLATNVAE
jgi:hypothetical protein